MWIAYLITTSVGTMGVFAINACLCIFMAIWLAVFGVETRGRTLEDITKGSARRLVDKPDRFERIHSFKKEEL